jgi:hypothetical protein
MVRAQLTVGDNFDCTCTEIEDGPSRDVVDTIDDAGIIRWCAEIVRTRGRQRGERAPGENTERQQDAGYYLRWNFHNPSSARASTTPIYCETIDIRSIRAETLLERKQFSAHSMTEDAAR